MKQILFLIGPGEDDAVFLHLVGTEDRLLALLHGGCRHGCALRGAAAAAEAAAVGKLIATIHTKCHTVPSFLHIHIIYCFFVFPPHPGQ